MSIVRNTESDLEFENRIRPQELETFAGQEKIVENLRIFIRAALMRGDSLDRVLLHGPPGLGDQDHAGQHHRQRDALAAQRSPRVPCWTSRATWRGCSPTSRRAMCSSSTRSTASSPHRGGYLYSAMEDYKIDIVLDKGPSARSIQIELAPFTLISATTRSSLLTLAAQGALRHLVPPGYYDAPVLAGIVHRSARILDVPIDEEAAHEVALRSRSTPRIANALLRRVRDFAMVKGDGRIDLAITRTALEAPKHRLARPRPHGQQDPGDDHREVPRRPRGTQHHRHGRGRGGRHGGEVYEPFLIKEGFLKRTPRGREATELAYRHLGLAPHDGGETGRLF